jgi:hypothetical protein
MSKRTKRQTLVETTQHGTQKINNGRNNTTRNTKRQTMVETTQHGTQKDKQW